MELSTVLAAADDSRGYVSLREYLERLLADHTAVHLKEAAVVAREAALVREVLEQRAAGHDQRHEEQHRADLRAVDEARQSLESRLEKLNELRQEVTKDRGQYITRGVFESKLEASEKERGELQKAVEQIRQELAAARGRQAAFAVVLGVALVVVPFVILLVFRIVGT